MSDQDQIDISTLLGMVLREHARLEAALADLTPAQFTQPSLAGGWTVKDTLAHLSYWAGRMLRAHATAARGEQWPPARVGDETWEQAIDRLNAACYQENRDRPLADVLAEYGTRFGEVLAMIVSLKDADLAESGPLATALGGPLLTMIAGDTYEHYQEHVEAIRAWLARQ